MSELIIGITHADSLAAEALLAVMPDLGFDAEHIRLFSAEDTAGNRLAFGSHYLVTKDQHQADYNECALVLQTELDESLSQKIADSGCVLLKLNGHVCFFADEDQSMQMDYAQSIYELADPSVYLMMKVINAVKRSTTPESVQAVVLRPASAKGKAGVDELAKQTVNLLNARSAEPVLFKTQQAFNVVAQNCDLEDQLRLLAGDDVKSVQLQSIDVAVFHGMTVVLTMQCDTMLSKPLLINDLKSISGMRLVVDDKEIVSPVDSLQKNATASISSVKMEGRNLSCVITADHYRHALAENFLNGLSIIRKTFL